MLAIALLSIAGGWAPAQPRDADPSGSPPNPDLAADAAALLARRCYACHGPDGSRREADLRLDLRRGALAVVVPGDPAASRLLERVQADDDDERMPPAESGPPLTASEIELLRSWVEAGAPFEGHWAFTPPRRRPLPEVRNRSWVRDDLDRFILARLEEAGLEPAPEAERAILARRAALVLTGLPPSPERVQAFLDDTEPGAYSRLVDDLLADPAYGERWASLWLDLARYADSAGYGSDPLRTIWPYRDWVIDAFNQNLPFDEFTRDQLAGDLVAQPTLAQRIASAFHRNTKNNTEGGTDDEEFRVEAVKDRTDTTMQVWMGLTFGCAKCHSHKYDPITIEEYYSLFAIFNQTRDRDTNDEQPLLAVPLPGGQGSSDAEGEVRIPVMEELPSDQRRTTHVLARGNFLAPLEEVQPGVPAAFHPWPEGAPRNRLGLAAWLTSPDNPLTARVTVNRFWAAIFGRGLVATLEDFGRQGARPTHPGLLDYLALEYVESGWDTRALLRRIVTSATFRQSAVPSERALRLDPEDRLYSRMPRRRLWAEAVRDQALAASGLLSRKLHGPPVYPPQPPGIWQAAFNGQREWKTSTGEDRYRRAIYTFWRRTAPYPSLATFDAPSRETCTLRRIATNTPLQVLVTLNDPVYLECAQALGRRMAAAAEEESCAGSTPDAPILRGLRMGVRACLVRAARPRELELLLGLYHSSFTRLGQESPPEWRALAGVRTEDVVSDETLRVLATWSTVAAVLLNLDEFLTRP